MVHSTTPIVGANFTRTTTDAEFAVGDHAIGTDGSEWVYVQADASGITGIGYIALLSPLWVADMLDLTNSATARGEKVGVAGVAFAASEFGWLQVAGVAVLRVLANAAANAVLNSTATVGVLDDDATVGSEDVDGIVLTTANGGAEATAAAILTHPIVGVTN